MNVFNIESDKHQWKESIWLSEYRVSKASQCVPISSVCNTNCIFCSNNNNPFDTPRAEFRPYDDIISNLRMIDYTQPIRLCENIPGRIKEGESLLHPQLWDILDHIRQKNCKSVIVFATNGSMLSEDMVIRLCLYKPILIDTLSLNSSNIENWMKLHRASKEKAIVAHNAPKLLKKYGIPFTASLVAMPMITGYDDIGKTLDYAYANGAQECFIWIPGYSKYVSKEIVSLMQCDRLLVEDICDQGEKRWGHYPQILPNNSVDLKHEICKAFEIGPDGGNLFMSSVLAYNNVCDNVKKYKTTYPNYVIRTHNKTYGGNIIVGGLLFVNDYIDAYFSSTEIDKKLIKRIFVSNRPFDLNGDDLLYNNISVLEEKNGKKVFTL